MPTLLRLIDLNYATYEPNWVLPAVDLVQAQVFLDPGIPWQRGVVCSVCSSQYFPRMVRVSLDPKQGSFSSKCYHNNYLYCVHPKNGMVSLNVSAISLPLSLPLFIMLHIPLFFLSVSQAHSWVSMPHVRTMPWNPKSTHTNYICVGAPMGCIHKPYSHVYI